MGGGCCLGRVGGSSLGHVDIQIVHVWEKEAGVNPALSRNCVPRPEPRRVRNFTRRALGTSVARGPASKRSSLFAPLGPS